MIVFGCFFIARATWALPSSQSAHTDPFRQILVEAKALLFLDQLLQEPLLRAPVDMSIYPHHRLLVPHQPPQDFLVSAAGTCWCRANTSAWKKRDVPRGYIARSRGILLMRRKAGL